jgi:o-succinylbenzoate synthase
MTIKSIETQVLTAPLKYPFQTALRRVERLEDLVVTIHTDEGLTGYGEGAPTPVITGETMGTMQAAIDYLSDFLIGKEFEAFDALIDTVQHRLLHNTTAKSALEIALYDLKAQREGVPLYRMLGGKRTQFETDITISLGDVDAMVRETLDAILRGYRILKIKVGEDPERDIARIEAIAQAVEEHIVLRLDANQGWSVEETIHVMRVLEHRGIHPELLEQPIDASNSEGLRQIREQIATPLLADEAVFSPDDARRLLENEAADMINIKLAKCGGISTAMKVIDVAEEFDVPCMLGCMLEGPLSIAAGLHVASARESVVTMFDLDAVALLSEHPAVGGVRFDESQLALSDVPGLGLRIK